MSAKDLEEDAATQHIDVRLFFPADNDREDFLDRLSGALQNSQDLCDLTAAYQIKAAPRPLA